MKLSSEKIKNFYSILKKTYPIEQISEERQKELSSLMEEYGYLPYPYIKALRELSDSEVLFCLETKFKNEKVLNNGIFDFSETSVLARNNINNSDWIKRECHDIKLINLSALGDRDKSSQKTRFLDWLRQIIILPTGNIQNDIFNTTIYLIPFHPRAFGCAYIPQASCVNPNLEDEEMTKLAGLNADEQVKMFVAFAQLAGHPVIYDILPQTGRFSKTVLANPACVRWFDVNFLINKISFALDTIWEGSGNKVLSEDVLNKYSKDNINKAISIYKNFIRGERKFSLSEQLKEILSSIDKDNNLIQYKKVLSNSMQNKAEQEQLNKKVQNIVQKYTGIPFDKITEKDIKNRKEIELALIKEGLWSLPGGAWNSAGVPVFDKMAKNALYPMMKHYNFKDEDVTEFANLDCQSPFYFVYLENGEYNNRVIEFFINFVKNIVMEYNFDGIRVDHVNHVIDDLSEKDGIPISYRIPKIVLKKLNDELKTVAPYFASLAEYMLRDGLYKEYHEDMNFDILYGNDIIFQNYKKVSDIDGNNINLASYNKKLEEKSTFSSVLKIYNNQDGEYKFINMYPGQLGKNGALFKWFKYKFFPGGYYAQRPMLYVDGDESYSIGGIEETVINEVFMKRNDDLDFYAKFDAIDRFAKNHSIICYGEAHILQQDDDGFVVWQVQTGDSNNILIAIANYNNPKVVIPKDNDFEYKTGQEITDKSFTIMPEYKFVSEFIFDGKNYVEKELDVKTNTVAYKVLQPAEFKFYRVCKSDV